MESELDDCSRNGNGRYHCSICELLQTIFRPINQLSTLLNTFQSAIAGAERVFEIMDEAPDIQDQESALTIDHLKGDVTFNNVHFSYESGKPILKNISFEAKAGEKIALVGPTGSGKTTIINLLMRFYELDSGNIKIDGRSISDYQISKLREKIGVVLQDTFLFTGSILENIRYGRLDATDDEVIEAAKLASAIGLSSIYLISMIPRLPEMDLI